MLQATTLQDFHDSCTFGQHQHGTGLELDHQLAHVRSEAVEGRSGTFGRHPQGTGLELDHQLAHIRSEAVEGRSGTFGQHQQGTGLGLDHQLARVRSEKSSPFHQHQQSTGLGLDHQLAHARSEAVEGEVQAQDIESCTRRNFSLKTKNSGRLNLLQRQQPCP